MLTRDLEVAEAIPEHIRRINAEINRIEHQIAITEEMLRAPSLNDKERRRRRPSCRRHGAAA